MVSDRRINLAQKVIEATRFGYNSGRNYEQNYQPFAANGSKYNPYGDYGTFLQLVYWFSMECGIADADRDARRKLQKSISTK